MYPTLRLTSNSIKNYYRFYDILKSSCYFNTNVLVCHVSSVSKCYFNTIAITRRYYTPNIKFSTANIYTFIRNLNMQKYVMRMICARICKLPKVKRLL